MTACSEASERDDTLAIDRDEVKDSVLYYLVGVDDTLLPDTAWNVIVEKSISKFVDNQTYTCDVIYDSLLETLKYLIRKAWVEEGGDSVGVLTKNREKEGSVEVELNYNVVDGQTTENGWQKLYEYFRSNPSDICECLKPAYSSTYGLINIGGTLQDKYTEAATGENNRTMWDRGSIGSKFTYRREERRRSNITRGKYWRNNDH